ncbi:MAG: hypothetical protein ACOC4G_05130 [Bacillota bacterium]
MTKGLGRERNISEEEKKEIARQMKEGYQKMAALNKKLAKEFFFDSEGEAKN